jgi:hypothetical protein
MSDKKYPVYMTRPPTDDFVGCFVGGGSPNVECHCGRNHIAIESDYLSDDERAYYNDENVKDPDGWIFEYGIDTIHYVNIGDKQFVDGCPCNGPRHYENLFWEHRKEYRRYLTIVKMKLLSQAADVGEWQEDL